MPIMYKDLGSISSTTKTYTQILIVKTKVEKIQKHMLTWTATGNLKKAFS